MRAASLHVYPLKSGRGISVESAFLEARGLAGDRRWLAATPEGTFLTQRECGALARIVAKPDGGVLHLYTEEDPSGVSIDAAGLSCRARIRIWRDEVDALAAGPDADAWLSDALGRPARLCYMDDAARRATSGQWGAPGPVSFADGYPLLIANAASLAALNAAIEEGGGAPVPMARFRPNIVVEGADPWAEDRWRTLRIGEAVVDLVKPCARCVVTTRDQQSGQAPDKEPLQTLARLRRSADRAVPGVLFGWNASVGREADLAAGDAVTVLEDRPQGWPLVQPLAAAAPRG